MAERGIGMTAVANVAEMRSPWHERALPYLLLAPTVLVLLLLTIYPLIYAVTVSLQTRSGGWTLGNFARLFGDRFFGAALLQTFVYTLAALIAEFLLGLGLALLLDSQIRARNLFRALLLNPNFGAINGTLKGWGFDTTKLTWIAGPQMALPSVILVDIWQWTPFMFLILLAGLQAIPQEPYEAAMIDGSSAWQTFPHITLPLLKPAILIALLLRTMDLLRIFDQVFILTQGGPGFATETISLYIYKTAFRFFDFGYAAAMSFVLLVLINFISVGYIRLLKRREAKP